MISRATLLAVLALVLASPAAASGPVFAVVPNAPSTPTVTPGSPSVGSSSELDQLKADQDALERARASRARATAALASTSAFYTSSPLLSDRLDGERRAAQFQLASDRAGARIGELEQQIDALETALQPAPYWGSDSLAPATATSVVGSEAVSLAERYLGVPYRWGSADPFGGFDCSGLTMYVYAQLGIRLRHYAADQWNDLPHVDPSQLQPGDLVFFEPSWDGPGHVGIFAGGDSFIEAPHTGDVVKIASLSQEAAALGFVGAARPPTPAEPTSSSPY